jgi:hypothetical protein
MLHVIGVPFSVFKKHVKAVLEPVEQLIVLSSMVV